VVTALATARRGCRWDSGVRPLDSYRGGTLAGVCGRRRHATSRRCRATSTHGGSERGDAGPDCVAGTVRDAVFRTGQSRSRTAHRPVVDDHSHVSRLRHGDRTRRAPCARSARSEFVADDVLETSRCADGFDVSRRARRTADDLTQSGANDW